MKKKLYAFLNTFLVLCLLATLINPVKLSAAVSASGHYPDAPASDGSFITLDATSSRYAAYEPDANGEYKAKANGVVLGKKQGLELQPATDYTVSFLYRVDEIVDPGDNDDSVGIGCSYACRMPLICVFSGGNKQTLKFPTLHYVYDEFGNAVATESMRQNPWNLEKGKWYSFEISFTTDKSISSDGEWISLISYGGMKSSYRKLTVTESNSDTVVYSLGDMPCISAFADMYTATYNDSLHESGDIYPEVRISQGVLKSEITLDTLNARYYSYDINTNGKYTGRVNGVSIGEEYGVALKPGTAYNISFEYCVKEIIRPTNDSATNPDSTGCSYSCRTPLMFIHRSGNVNKQSTVYFDRYIKVDGVETVDTAKKAFQSPWELQKNKWYSFSIDFTTEASVVENAVWFSLVSYGGMKSSFRNIVITAENEAPKSCYLGELGDGYALEPMYSTVYNDADKSTEVAHPETAISVDISDGCLFSDGNSDLQINIKDLISVKKQAAGEKSQYTALSLSVLKKRLLGIVQKDVAEISLKNGAPVLENYMGFSAISQGFMYMPDLYGREYTEKQKNIFIERLKNSGVKTVRSYYDQGYAAVKNSDGSFKKDANGKLLWDWETAEMQGLYSWLQQMKDNGITVVLNMSWNAAVLMQKTSYGLENPFYGMTVSEVTGAYADWASQSVNEIVIKRGFTNVEYASMFTEPYADTNLYGKKISELSLSQAQSAEYTLTQTDWYPSMIAAFDSALREDGIRNKIKILGPNAAMRADLAAQENGTTLETRIEWWVEKLDAYIDAYAFHWYPPAYPDNAMPSSDLKQKSYLPHAEYLARVTSVLEKTGKPFWFDELNFTANMDGVYLHEYVKQGWSGTQLAQLFLTNVNCGVQNTFLWSFNDEQWPLLNQTSKEFIDGVHMTGIFPRISQSLTPYKQYYAYTLLTKYFGADSDAKAYKALCDKGFVAAMIQTSDGNVAIAVVNTNSTRKEFKLTADITLGGKKLYRCLYNPETVTPDDEATVISADKTFTAVEAVLSDSLPAGGVAIYTSATR